MKKIIIFGLLITVLIVAGCIKETIQTCGEMNLEQARKIASESECAEEGALTREYFCNENTGTWWLDLDIEKEGCNPACVVNVNTKEAEINWRCTGLIIEECESDDDCKNGYVCYNTKVCSMTPQGVVSCGEQQGDLRCHKSCENNGDCDLEQPYCTEVTFWSGDAGIPTKICMKDDECKQDSDCVPVQCCHPTSCVPDDQAPDCSGIACTMVCAPGTMDCGSGHCGCIDGECQVIWTMLR